MAINTIPIITGDGIPAHLIFTVSTNILVTIKGVLHPALCGTHLILDGTLVPETHEILTLPGKGISYARGQANSAVPSTQVTST
jgi:hypothetical protein